MRVLGISGSPRRGGNTDFVINTALGILAEEGLETEFVSLANRAVQPCLACGRCLQSEKVQCLQEDPAFEGMLEKFSAAQGILIGSPVYFGSATPQMMARWAGWATSPGGIRKLFPAEGRGGHRGRSAAGHNFTFAQLNYFFLISEMVVPGSSYWDVVTAREKGEAEDDTEGMTTVKTLARNMAWLMKKLGE